MSMSYSYEDLKERYDAFLKDETRSHVQDIQTAIDDAQRTQSCPRVKISMSDLRQEGFSNEIRMDPMRHLRALQDAAHGIATDLDLKYADRAGKIKVAIEGPVGAAPSSPRQLNSSHLRQLVCVEGVATKVSTIKPKVVKSVHYCPGTKEHSEREYVDATDPNLGLKQVDTSGQELPDRYVSVTTSVYPTKDRDNNPLETEFGLSQFKDHQTITLQEMPEKAPMGQLPRSVELVLDHDLVDRIKPGDRVMVMGVFRALSNASAGQLTTSGVFPTVVLVNHVQILGRDVQRLTIDVKDIQAIKQLAARKDILDVLGRSISPSIHGHEIIKKALALQLLSGVEKNLDNGTHLRGDINILMVGDPSTAKSQLLRSAMIIAPLAVSTTGKGSSGVGLTAAVTSDPDTRERRLEAGAMVLADRGLVCVDEFDKMGENDRVAIHEAMEQQTVTIAKAGIHASLNARCSVLAAANPVYGQYDRRRRIQENIGLPDSLLSRFDLLFVVLDQMDPESDRNIATHVIRGHRYRPDRGETGHDSDYDDDASDDGLGDARVHSVWQKNRQRNGDVLQHDFLRKFLLYAKQRKPVLTEEAREAIANRYAEMRARQDERTLPITARSLETVIRLATAHAKARLSPEVETTDCEVALDILSFALYHENRAAKTRAAPVSDDETERSVRQRVEEVEGTIDKLQKEVLDKEESDENTMSTPVSTLKAQIWQTIVDNDNVCSISDFKGDKDQVRAALVELETEGRIQLEDDQVFGV